MNVTTPRLPDPLLDEIRAIKMAVSAEFDHDVVKLCQQLIREQEASGRPLVNRRTAPSVQKMPTEARDGAS